MTLSDADLMRVVECAACHARIGPLMEPIGAPPIPPPEPRLKAPPVPCEERLTESSRNARRQVRRRRTPKEKSILPIVLWIAVAFAGAGAVLVMVGVMVWTSGIWRIEQQLTETSATSGSAPPPQRPAAPPISPSTGDTGKSDDVRPDDKSQLSDDTAPAAREGKVPDELQGEWEPMFTMDVERKEQLLPSKEPPLSSEGGSGLIIKGNRAEWNSMGSLRAGKGRVSVNLATSPPRLDLKTGNRVYKCIYHVWKGKEEWRLKLDPEGEDYPAGLDEIRGPKGNGYLDIFLHRPPPRGRPLAKDTPGAKKPKIAWRQPENPKATENLKLCGLGLTLFNSTYEGLPPGVFCDASGKPLLSWRVAMLPYAIERRPTDLQLDDFHLNEPWDSPHNRKLILRMPATFAMPGDPGAAQGLTHYRAFVGKDTAFPVKPRYWNNKPELNVQLGRRIPHDFPDGPNQTLLVVEATEAVPWTKPDELVYDPGKSLPALGLPSSKGFHAVFADGSVTFLPKNLSDKTLRALITPAGGETLDLSELGVSER